MPTLDASKYIVESAQSCGAGDNLTVGPILLGDSEAGKYFDSNGNGEKDCKCDSLTVVDAV